ncbi:MAG: FixH family protein [Flavihumibacter sp.]|nr:FixH family protein [Flavihumibacter sp.]
MALNFGHKLVLVFIAFGLLMGTLIYMSVKTEFELVSKDYYKEELAYQQVIDARNNAANLTAAIQLSYRDKMLKIQLPAEMVGKVQSGQIIFYCPSDSDKDTVLDLQPDATGQQSIEIGKSILPAAYKLKFKWQANDTAYYQENFMNLQ